MSIQLSTSDAGAGGLRGEVRDGWGVRAMDYYEYAIASIKYSSSFSTTTQRAFIDGSAVSSR
jgi:hypothetical protein